tara:strand:+ start:46607 stop:47653 length:1047 start_codon:yes stop_codon:yes gene_type:complete
MSDKIYKEIVDAFDVKSDDTAESSDYGTTAENTDELSAESFDALVDGVNQNIDTNENGFELESPPMAKKEIAEIEEITEEVEEPVKEDDATDDITEELVEELMSEDLEGDEITREEGEGGEEDEEEEEERYLGKKQFENGNINWNFDTPSKLFESFYFRKKDLIEPLLSAAGKLPFDSFHDELGECHIKISDIYDSNIISQEMTLIQQHRERVKEIQLQVIRQYFLWELHVEQLEGELARTQYLKPQIKQKGLESAHMGDVQRYFAELKGVRDAAKKVEDHLHAAFETLSRKVTVCETLKPVERVSSDTSPASSEPSDLDDYDELPQGAVAEKREMEEEFLGWGEIPT